MQNAIARMHILILFKIILLVMRVLHQILLLCDFQETKKLKEQTNGLYVKSRPGQKRKIHEKSNQIKQRKRTKEEPHVEETSILKE